MLEAAQTWFGSTKSKCQLLIGRQDYQRHPVETRYVDQYLHILIEHQGHIQILLTMRGFLGCEVRLRIFNEAYGMIAAGWQAVLNGFEFQALRFGPSSTSVSSFTLKGVR